MTTKNDKRKPKTIMEKKFIKALPLTKNATEAARIAGYKDPTQSAYENKIKLDISSILDNAGLTDEKLVIHLCDIILANKIISTKSNELLEVPDNGARFRGLKLAFELKGSFPSKGSAIANKTATELRELLFDLTAEY